MSVNNKQDEDYLDSLLRSVLGGAEGQNNEQLNNNDLEDGSINDELLGNIEKDLFAEGIDNADVKLSFENEPVDVEEVESSKPTKQEKKHRWGRKAKKQENEDVKGDDIDNIIKYEPKEALDGIDRLFADEFTSQEAKEENPVSEETIVPPEGFEDIFADETNAHEEGMSGADDGMADLYDIFGVNEGVEESENSEIEKLEEEKPSKKKKVKKEKKGLFGRKKAKTQNEDDKEEADNLTEDIFGTASMEQQDEDLGFEGIGDLFVGGSEEGSFEDEKGENERLIEDIENGNYDEEDILSQDEEEKPKKKKKEKKKKEKKEKKPKKEKEKKVKVKKEKKPKKPKEPDEIIPISKPFIIFSISLIVLIVVCLVLGGKYYNYTTKTDAALAYYLNQDYEAAYNELAGLEMHEDDQPFYDQIETIMYVQRHYTSYKGLYKIEKYDKALHTLLRGVKMYDKYKEQARELNCFDDITTVLSWIDKALLEDYGLTESQARELNLIEDRYEYANKIYEISDMAKERAEAEKEAVSTENGSMANE